MPQGHPLRGGHDRSLGETGEAQSIDEIVLL